MDIKLSVDASGLVKISGSAPERIWAMETIETGDVNGKGILGVDMNLISYIRADLLSEEERERIRSTSIRIEDGSKNIS